MDQTASSTNWETILQVVRQWPINEQIALADAILANAHNSAQSAFQQPVVPSAALRGILTKGQPTPTDEDIERILEEERMKKYGG